MDKPHSVRPPVGGSMESPSTDGRQEGYNSHSTSSVFQRTPTSERTDLPSWLIEQPTQFDLPTMRLQPTAATGQIPSTPVQRPVRPSPAEWQPAPANANTAETAPPKHVTGSHPVPKGATGPQPAMHNSHDTEIQPASPEWQPSEDSSAAGRKQVGSLKSLSRETNDLIKNAVPLEHAPLVVKGQVPTVNHALAANGANIESEIGSPALWGAHGAATGPFLAVKRNYSALVAALETLGYSVPGFIASAVVNLNGQPIAQVAIDDIDISLMCGYFSTIMQGTLLSLDQGRWGQYGQTVITSATHHILLRIVGSEKDAFQVLITTHESNPTASLEVMANVDAAIASALPGASA